MEGNERCSGHWLDMLRHRGCVCERLLSMATWLVSRPPVACARASRHSSLTICHSSTCSGDCPSLQGGQRADAVLADCRSPPAKLVYRRHASTALPRALPRTRRAPFAVLTGTASSFRHTCAMRLQRGGCGVAARQWRVIAACRRNGS